MPIQLYNTLARRKEPLNPRDPQNVRMYVCGPTVYDLAHVGNARPVVVFDVLYRLLRHAYEKVTYVRNITDVEDKIIAAAKERGEDIDALTARTTKAYHEDMAAIGAMNPTYEPRATDHIPQMIAMIQRLIDRGHAYPEEGHVLFDVPSMPKYIPRRRLLILSDEPSKPEYGRLSRHNRQELIDGARVEVAPYKRDPADFVLWKPSTDEQPGWESPWGRGRPGWHIECSAMSADILGEHFDIHGGGQDLIFPHHENELAQSVCAQETAPSDGGEPFVNIWMHNGYVVANGEKMSKSLGNFFTVRQLLEEGVRGEVIRLALLSAHYRQPLDMTRDKLIQIKEQLERFYVALKLAEVKLTAQPMPSHSVVEALSDDLNTPKVLAEMHELANALNKAGTSAEKARLKGALLGAGRLLGLLEADPEAWFKGVATGGLDAARIEKMIAARNTARKAKNFTESDRIRDALAAKGIVLEDLPDGTTDWRRA